MLDNKYVLRQINIVGDTGKYNPKIKILTEHGETKWIDINWESIRKLKAIFQLEKEDVNNGN